MLHFSSRHTWWSEHPIFLTLYDSLNLVYPMSYQGLSSVQLWNLQAIGRCLRYLRSDQNTTGKQKNLLIWTSSPVVSKDGEENAECKAIKFSQPYWLLSCCQILNLTIHITWKFMRIDTLLARLGAVQYAQFIPWEHLNLLLIHLSCSALCMEGGDNINWGTSLSCVNRTVWFRNSWI